LTSLILSADIHFALEALTCSSIYPIKRNIFNRPGMGLIDRRCVIPPICMDVSICIYMLPYFFLSSSILHPLQDLANVFPDDRTNTLSSSFAISDVNKILAVKHPGITQHSQMFFLLIFLCSFRQRLN